MNFVDVGKSILLKSAPLHSHDLWEIELNLEGSGTNCVEGQIIEFKKGTVICLPPGFTHSKTAKNGFKDTFIHCRTLNITNKTSFTVLRDDEGTLSSLFFALFDVFKKQQQSSNQICQTIFEAIERIINSEVSSNNGSTRIEEIKNIILNNYHDPDFSVANLSEIYGYCDDHMRRIFKKETGKTMLEYLTDLRINQAKKLLSENDLLHYSVAEIGTACGFYDISYFSRVFKKKTGIAPSEYK